MKHRPFLTCVLALAVMPGFMTVALCRATDYVAGADYIQIYAAAQLLVMGENPYGASGLARIQGPLLTTQHLHPLFREQGFSPFLYPPWMALIFSPLAQLPYAAARTIWVGVIVWSLAVSAWWLGRMARHPSPFIWVVLTLTMPASIYGLKLGQTAPLVLLCAVTALWCLKTHRDWLAGSAVALTTIKPQLVVLLIPATLLWAAIHRRWAVSLGFAAILSVVVITCTWLDHQWLSEMLRAMLHAPYRGEVATSPGMGTTWPLVLQAAGLRGAALAACVVALILVAAYLTTHEALRHDATPLDVMGIAVSAAFVVAPYAQVYDFSILVLSAAALAARRSGRSAWAAALAFYAIPWSYLALPLARLPIATLSVMPALFMIAIASRKAPKIAAETCESAGSQAAGSVSDRRHS